MAPAVVRSGFRGPGELLLAGGNQPPGVELRMPGEPAKRRCLGWTGDGLSGGNR
jgi:hypothetical protein